MSNNSDSKRLNMMLYTVICKTYLKQPYNRNLLMNHFQPIAIILSYHLVYQPGLSSSGTWCPRISVTRCCWWKWTRYLDFIFYSMTHGAWGKLCFLTECKGISSLILIFISIQFNAVDNNWVFHECKTLIQISKTLQIEVSDIFWNCLNLPHKIWISKRQLHSHLST